MRVAPTRKNFPGGFEDTTLELVHFSKKEAKTYDFIQNPNKDGLPFLDDEIEIRSYAPFGELIKDEGFRNFFLEAAKEEEAGPPESIPFEEMEEHGERTINQIEWMPAPGDEIPEIKELASKGRKGDSVMVLMPANMVYLLGLIKGEVAYNPMTGFAEFGGVESAVGNVVKSVVRVGATVAGAIAGGPVGAVLGSVAGSALTGRKPKDWISPALQSGALSWGLSGLQSMAPSLASSSIPGMQSVASGLQAMPQVPGLNAGLSNMGLPSFAAPAAGATNAAAVAPGVYEQVAASSAPSAAPAAASLWDNPLIKYGAPLGITLGAGLLAKKGDQEEYKNKLREQERAMQRQEEMNERHLQRIGFYEPLKRNDIRKVVNPRFGMPGEPYYLHEGDSAFEDYANRRVAASTGGAIHSNRGEGGKERKDISYKDKIFSGQMLTGKGNGTSDNIHAKVPENTFIIPAWIVSALGNGDSSSGHKKIKQWLKDMEESFGWEIREKFKHIENGMLDIPVSLSVGEVAILPYHVCMAGHGHLSKGISTLEHLVDVIREHKKKVGDSNPPDALSIEEYLKK